MLPLLHSFIHLAILSLFSLPFSSSSSLSSLSLLLDHPSPLTLLFIHLSPSSFPSYTQLSSSLHFSTHSSLLLSSFFFIRSPHFLLLTHSFLLISLTSSTVFVFSPFFYFLLSLLCTSTHLSIFSLLALFYTLILLLAPFLLAHPILLTHSSPHSIFLTHTSPFYYFLHPSTHPSVSLWSRIRSSHFLLSSTLLTSFFSLIPLPFSTIFILFYLFLSTLYPTSTHLLISLLTLFLLAHPFPHSFLLPTLLTPFFSHIPLPSTFFILLLSLLCLDPTSTHLSLFTWSPICSSLFSLSSTRFFLSSLPFICSSLSSFHSSTHLPHFILLTHTSPIYFLHPSLASLFYSLSSPHKYLSLHPLFFYFLLSLFRTLLLLTYPF